MSADLLLNDVESLGFFFKNLWFSKVGMDSQRRLRLNIVDTIIFKKGSPVRWLFTSDQNGVCNFPIYVSY